ncbi:MAG: AAA family ATPase [Gammaproteobacteria bacterium]
MNNINYFPTGIADSESFCNRKLELSKLGQNIVKGAHTLLYSPRRYGKSSLAKQAVKHAQIPHAEIDFFVAIDATSVEKQFLYGVKQLIQSVSDTPEQWFHVLRNFFNKANKKWTIGITGFSLELIPERNNDVAVNILDALMALEHVLAKKKQRVLFFIDEFQEISHLAEAKAIEGAIRHFAQSTKHVVFIFSGSNRHLLINMFNDRSRPLYLLCDRIQLNRITVADYKIHLNKIAFDTWKAALSETTFQKIINYTECHPFYVNILCDRLWSHLNNLPTVNDVETVWLSYVNEQRTETRRELLTLGTAQLKMLVAIASGENHALTRLEIQQKLKLTSSAITQALQALEEKDYIEKQEERIFVIINPLLKASLLQYYHDYF